MLRKVFLRGGRNISKSLSRNFMVIPIVTNVNQREPPKLLKPLSLNKLENAETREFMRGYNEYYEYNKYNKYDKFFECWGMYMLGTTTVGLGIGLYEGIKNKDRGYMWDVYPLYGFVGGLISGLIPPMGPWILYVYKSNMYS